MPEAKFVVRLGDWPSPECSIYQDGDSVYRYDYQTDSWSLHRSGGLVGKESTALVDLPVYRPPELDGIANQARGDGVYRPTP